MNKLLKSIAEFQQEVPVIHKETEGYGYSYADLPQIFKIINPLLKKHGLGFYQCLEGTSLKTVVFHVESGELIESSAEIPQGVTLSKMNTFQVLGSAITYFRRYQISAMLGLVTDKDTDIQGTEKKLPTPNPKQWQGIINKFSTGEVTIDKIKENFSLTKEQEQEIIKL